MDINEINDWKDKARHKEVALWKQKYERTVRLCKAIWEERASIECIKYDLEHDYALGASEAWNELDYPVQELLITAPRFGGPFTTQERTKLKELWDVSITDIEKR